jgi:hypothetical protein
LGPGYYFTRETGCYTERVRSALLALLAVGTAPAQQVLPAKPASISFAEGIVTVEGRQVLPPARAWQQLGEREALRSGAGARAELLLNACTVLHLDENSSLRMIANRVEDLRVELLAGSIFVQTDAVRKGAKVTVVAGGVATPLARPGVYRFDAEPPVLKVYAGKATPERTGRRMAVGSGRAMPLAGSTGMRKFTPEKNGDAFGRWSERRIEWLAHASGAAEREAAERRQRAATGAAMDQPDGSFMGAGGRPSTWSGPERVPICAAGVK